MQSLRSPIALNVLKMMDASIQACYFRAVFNTADQNVTNAI